ncbi:protein FAM135A-like [Xenopus laevis]|uniref:Protein FAM135A-like n=1 Tax=Xenopus laevis TaxID=8355 RepID=A0A8J1LRW5_XENLA|nr:protein FAM135A-like [Xenopus laevis]
MFLLFSLQWQIEETLNTLESKMNFGLYYAESHKELSKCKRSAPMWREDMKLHFNLHRGIHGQTNIVFESCSKLSIIVHGLLVVLQPPLKTFSKKNSVFQRILPSRWRKAKKTKVESVILGKNFKKKLAADGKSFVIEEKYLQHAYRFLSTLRSCLLLSYDGLYSYFISVSETLPSSCKLELGM